MIQVPLLWGDENYVIQLYTNVAGFNQNTHQAQASKDQSEEIIANYNMMINSIFGTFMEVAMQFVCDERIVS
jgi:hypothetical protein